MPSGNSRTRDDRRGPQGQRNKKRRVLISSSDSSEGIPAISQPKPTRDKESDRPFKKPLLRPDQETSPKSTQKSSPQSIHKLSSRSNQTSFPQSFQKPSPRPNQKPSLQPSSKSTSPLRHAFLPGKSSPQSVQKPFTSQKFLSGKPDPQPEYKTSYSLKPSSLRQTGSSQLNQKTRTPRQDQKPSTRLSHEPAPQLDQESSPRPKKKVSFEVDQEPSSLFAPRVTPWALSAPSQELRPLPSQKSIPSSNRESDDAHNGDDKDELKPTPQIPAPPSKRDAGKVITGNEAEEPQKADSDIGHPPAKESSSSEELFGFRKDNKENIQSDRDSGYSESSLGDFIVDDDDHIVPVRRSKRIKSARTGRNKNNRGTAKRDATARSRERPEKEWGAAVKQLDEKLDTLGERIGHLHDLMAKGQEAPDDKRETHREDLEMKTRKLDLEKRRIDLEEQRLGFEKENSTRLHQVIQDLISLSNSLQSRRSPTPPHNTQHKENGISAKKAHANGVLGHCDNAERNEENGGQLSTEAIM